jgi:oxepin-CoA hydrolase / 3-oxo-5,6-dehydrosuberyl-CoA semialdehyde dehydrogenase
VDGKAAVADKLASYIQGKWHVAPDEGTRVFDAVTRDVVAEVSSSGVDMAAMLQHSHRVGGPALRDLTFHQRADLLKQLAGYLSERKDELYALSPASGALKRDMLIDVDGGIATLFVFASKGRKELPDDTILFDGDAEQLGRGGQFFGRHVYLSLQGAAVQINAYNFPVWAFLEKLGPAVLAGVPTIVKPATQTAYLAAAAARQVIESGILPEGALQFVAGSVGDLFDHLGGHDLVTFTGSADTASRLRSHPAVVRRSARFNAEADSLNCSILGPDAAPGSPEFDLFVRALVDEMTIKTGQKCTAIRRAFVPRSVLADVTEATKALLDQVVIGNPGSSGVTMGPVVSLAQREEVRRAVKEIAGVAEIVSGDPDHCDPVDADTERGAFLTPILMVAEDVSAEAPHEVEPFGPVSTLMPYDSTPEVVALAARGQGSLAGSVVTSDVRFARDIVVGIGPWHGRVLVLDRDDAAESTGHGSPLPHLVHGGPGRAGGGEELGGIRAVKHHMQRVAVQGSPTVLAAVEGAGAPEAGATA